MSLRKLFGGGKSSKPEEQQAATQRLRELEDIYQRKSDYLEKKIADEVSAAKANATKNRTAAMNALKRKKRYEEQLQQVQGTLTNLETQRETLDNARANAEIFRVMNQTGGALKKEHKELNADKVHKMMDDFDEQQSLAKEIGEAISTPTAGVVVDEDDLLAELAGLEQEKLEEDLLNVGPVPELPAVPATAMGARKPAAAAAKSDEEKELEELAAQMAA